MKVSIRDAQASLGALGELSEVKLPAVTAYRVARVMKALKDPLDAFDTARRKLLAGVGKPSEADPDKYDIVDMEKWRAELDLLLAQEVDLPGEKFKIADLGDTAVEPKLLFILEWLFE